MKQTLRFLLCLLLGMTGAIGMSANELVNGLWVSPTPGADFDGSTVWYNVSNYKTGGTRYYLSTASGYTEGLYVLKLSNTTPDTSDAGLWCIVSDGAGAYKFSTSNSSKAAMVAVGGASSTSFTFQTGTNSAGVSGWFIRDGKLGNNYWNQQGGYIGHWNSSSAVGDNNSTFIFEVVGDVPDVPVPEVFSASAEDATYYGLKFHAGTVYISEGNKLGDLLITKRVFDTAWALIGDASGFKLLSSGGYYVGVKSAQGASGGTSNYCYTVATEAQATDFILITNSDGTYEIARKSAPGTTFNPWTGMDAGKNIGFWNAGDGNNRLDLVDGANLTFADYKVVNGGERPTDISTLSLWYDFPATLTDAGNPWMEYGLPIGNGQIGATLMGGVLRDEIVLNEKTLYNGSPTDYGEHGKYACLGTILVDDFSGMASINNGSRPINDYVRYLDIEQGVAGVNFSNDNGTKFSRRYVTSAPNRVLAAHY